MFLEYYGLREQPFGVTPDPRYLYFSAMHREALSSLFYGIETGCAFLTLIAPPGLGKTTLLLHLLERLRRSARTVFLFQTQCDSREFFRHLLTDLGVDASNQNMAHMHEVLNSVLLSNARMGRRFALIIDEAQNLKKSVLETVRLLSDFETPAAKLMQIVLSGQPQLADRLSHPDLMQLRQRISIVSRLHPFTRVEMILYIHHRLNVAGYSGAPLFNYDAIDQIVAHSDGVPRNINNICFNALTLGYAKRQKPINGSIVREVLADLDIDALRSHSVAPAFATQDSSSSVDGLEPTDEATDQEFHFAARAARVKGVEGTATEGHAESASISMTPGGDSNPPAAVSQRDSSELEVAESRLGQKATSAKEILVGATLAADGEQPEPAFVTIGSQEHMQAVAHDSPVAPDIRQIEIPEQSSVPTASSKEALLPTFGAQADTATLSFRDSEPRKHWKLIAACGAVLLVAGVGGVPSFHHESVGDGVVVRVDPASKNFKTASTNPPKDTIPSVRAERQQSAPMNHSIPSVTSDTFRGRNARPVSTHPAAEAQVATASSSDAELVFSGENINELLGITSSFDSSDDLVLPSPTYNSDRLFSVAQQVKQHELLSRIPPQYLLVARRGRVEGDVVVNFVVEESGNVSDRNIVSGPMMLRKAALNALRSWNYKPSQLAGQPVAVTSLQLP